MFKGVHRKKVVQSGDIVAIMMVSVISKGCLVETGLLQCRHIYVGPSFPRRRFTKIVVDHFTDIVAA